MKHNNFYTIQRASHDLQNMGEYWQTETYAARDRYVVDCYRKARGGDPSKNMHYLREVTFAIDGSVTLDALVRLSAKIRSVFVIDCFQISIDRQASQAHMLFDFMNKDTMSIVQINQSNFTSFQVLLIRTLGLPVPEDLRDQWSYFALRSAAMEDPDIFQKILKECSHLKLNKHYYTVIRDLIDFAGSRIENITGRLLKIK